jgi:hypothetical protein
MTLLHLHHDHVRSGAREQRSPLTRALKRIGAGSRWMHRAIVGAKLRRVHMELMFRHDYDEWLPPEQDIKKFPQRPLILGDKWDF